VPLVLLTGATTTFFVLLGALATVRIILVVRISEVHILTIHFVFIGIDPTGRIADARRPSRSGLGTSAVIGGWHDESPWEMSLDAQVNRTCMEYAQRGIPQPRGINLNSAASRSRYRLRTDPRAHQTFFMRWLRATLRR
jgi:hypothetical protein